MLRTYFSWLTTLVTLAMLGGAALTRAEPLNPTAVYRARQWEYSAESAFTFQVVPNPFASIINLKLSNANPIDYRLATQMISARYRLTNAWGPSILRGSLQASGTLVGTAIVSGPESYFVGLALGFRYDFVQPRARLIPYIEFRGGPGLTDSNGVRYSQQQDFVFTYLLGAGLRYECSPQWSISLGALDQHLSNGYLAEHNWGFDSLGVHLSVFHRF